jgi:hypothetical protein
MRVDINQEHVFDYAEKMERGDVFPPVVVFYDGLAHWLADGFHRVAAVCLVATRKLGTDEHAKWTTISADVRSGTRQDAIRFAISANRTNGLRRTNADKQIAVRAALAHPDMQGMSDRAIAEVVGVDHKTVAACRDVGKFPNSTQPLTATHKAVNTPTDRKFRTGVDGKQYPVKAKASTPAPLAPAPKQESRSDSAPIRTTAHGGDAVERTKHVCPTCGGKGYIND